MGGKGDCPSRHVARNACAAEERRTAYLFENTPTWDGARGGAFGMRRRACWCAWKFLY